MKVMPMTGWVSVTVGGRLVGWGGVFEMIRMRTPALRVIAPRLSVALAASVVSPAGALLQMRDQRLELRVPAELPARTPSPRLWLLAKNSTEATEPSVSRASASRAMFAPTGKVVFGPGWAIATVGGRLVCTGASLSAILTVAALGEPIQ